MSTIDGVILKSPMDWDMWNREFQAEAKRRNLLEQIKNSLPFLSEPILPDPKNFQTQVQTRASSTGSGATTANNFADLSSEGRANLQLALSFYQCERKIYEKQQEGLEKLQNWMTKTVAMSYKKTCFGIQDIMGWYQALKDQAGVDEYHIKRNIKDAYKRAVKPLSKPPKDFESWIANWEQIMAQGLERNLSFALDLDDWFEDFLSAVIQIDPTWTEAYRLTNEKGVREGTLSYHTLANDFRDVVRNLSSARSTRVAKGAFGTTFDGQGAGNESDSSNSTLKDKPEKKKTGKQTRKRGHSKSLATATGECRACKQGHDLQACYYIFPGKAPKWFRPRPDVKEQVEENIKMDDSLAEEIKRIKKPFIIK